MKNDHKFLSLFSCGEPVCECVCVCSNNNISPIKMCKEWFSFGVLTVMKDAFLP